jgi:hypothetical protein
MGELRQLPLYPDPFEHQAYVAAVELPWPLEGVGYRVCCPAADCGFMRWAVFADFHAAWRQAAAHRVSPAAELPL